MEGDMTGIEFQNPVRKPELEQVSKLSQIEEELEKRGWMGRMDEVQKIPRFSDSDSEEIKNTKYRLWEKALDDKDASVRIMAAKCLPVIGSTDSEKVVVTVEGLWEKALNDNHEMVRYDAVERLPDFNATDSETVTEIKKKLWEKAQGDETETVRAVTARMLPDFNATDSETVTEIKKKLWERALVDGSPNVRSSIAGRLPEFSDTDNKEMREMKYHLLEKALNDEDSNVRYDATSRLPNFSDTDNKETREMKYHLLEKALNDESISVRDSATDKLPSFSDTDDEELREAKFRLVEKALCDDSSYCRVSSRGCLEGIKVEEWGEVGKFLELNGLTKDINEVSGIMRDEDKREYFRWLFVLDHRQDGWLTEDEMRKSTMLGVSPMEYALAKGINFDWEHETSEERWKELIDTYKQEISKWKLEGDEVLEGFDLLVDNFGYRNAFKYLERKKLSKHDALYAMDSIMVMCEKSGLTKEQFWGNILGQVAMDDATYAEGCAQQHMNQLAMGTNLDLDRVMRVAKIHKIPEMNELLKKYSSYGAIFESWSSLRRYTDLVNLIGTTDILTMIDSIGNERIELSNYAKTLLFHKDSKVSVPAVTKFLDRPDEFLRADDPHAPKEVHERKKPSRYSHIPNLDMSGSDLRDSLVEGTMDRIQGFPPLKIRYEIPVEYITDSEMEIEKTNGQVMEEIKQVMAKGKESKEARAAFGKMREVVGRENVRGFLEGTFLASDEQWRKLKESFVSVNLSGKMAEIEVQVHRKSDPMAAIAGDDTANCMPFGSGKNTVYTFNTNTGLMTVRLKMGDKWRTIAESVITRDIEVNNLEGVSADIFRKELAKSDGRLDLVLPEEVLEENKKVVPVIDNIEVAKGFIEKKWQKTIKSLYSDFWSVYLKKQDSGLADEGKVRAGLGYDDLGGLYDGKETTKWIPRAMVSYSDALGENMGVIETKDSLEKYRTEITEEKTGKPVQTEISERGRRNGVRYATVDDALAVGWLESKVYNESGAGEFVEGGAAMENMLIATQINNIRKERPQMSLVHIGEMEGKKTMDGYLMAYEGKLYGGGSEMSKYAGGEVLYVEDMAARAEAKIGAGAMLAEFIELYRKNYLEKDRLIPIFMQARESTSFVLVQKQLENMAGSLGLKIQVIGETAETGSNNDRHSILLVPEK